MNFFLFYKEIFPFRKFTFPTFMTSRPSFWNLSSFWRIFVSVRLCSFLESPILLTKGETMFSLSRSLALSQIKKLFEIQVMQTQKEPKLTRSGSPPSISLSVMETSGCTSFTSVFPALWRRCGGTQHRQICLK